MKAKWFVKGDWDGFVGLFIDNLLQLLLIATLCPLVCGIPLAMVAGVILPGAAASITPTMLTAMGQFATSLVESGQWGH